MNVTDKVSSKKFEDGLTISFISTQQRIRKIKCNQISTNNFLPKFVLEFLTFGTLHY